MTEDPAPDAQQSLESAVARARAGDRVSLESVMRATRKDVYALALRYLWNPQDAEDATQDILIRVLTGLGGFKGESGFRTWVYRVAVNALLTARTARRQHPTMSFDELGEDLVRGLSGAALRAEDVAGEGLLLEEVKIGCTLAMLQCLDDDHRLAYILGEVMELDHSQASVALSTTQVAFRKRLSRARASVVSFMTSRCGLMNPDNPCRCHRRLDTALELGRVDAQNLVFANSPHQARRFPQVLAEIRLLEDGRRAAALFRSHPGAPESQAFSAWLNRLLRATRSVDQ